MAISSLSTGRSNSLLSRLKTFLPLQKLNHTLGEGARQAQCYPDMGSGSGFEPDYGVGQIEISKWKKLDSREMGITRSMIPVSPWIVLKVLQSAGFEAYLVGGCVRDLLLNRIPKDFDVITTAALTQIKKKFHRSEIVGRRFPICRVHVKGTVVEVSSFETVAENDKGKEEFLLPKMPKGCDHKDIARWRNCMHRDFTVNSLFFDPFVNKIYDYANAMLDIRSSKLRTLIPAEVSFEEDCARILRGLRLAARLNFSFSKEAESAICKLSLSIRSLAKSRILMELDYMLSFGAAEASLYLLQRYRLLDILLPVQAAHLAQQDCSRSGESPLMLMKLFSNLDRLFSCDRPSHGCLWVAIFSVHLALINNPQQALVVLTFASVLYHGRWKEGVRFARQHVEAAHIYVPEISDCRDSISDDELGERITQFARYVKDCVDVLTETGCLQETMMKFPGFPCSGLVFISKKMGSTVKQMFNVLELEVTTLNSNRQSLEINYGSLGKGNLRELRFVLGKIILNALGCGVAPEEEHVKEEKNDLHAPDSDKKAEVFVENCPTGVDTRKRHSMGKKEKKCSTLPADSEHEQEVTKKQKLMVNDNDLSAKGKTKNHKVVASEWPMDVAIEHQDFFEDNNCLQMAKKHRGMLAEGIGRVFQNYASKMQEKDGSRQLEIKSVLETVKYQMTQPGLLIEDQELVDNQENKKIAKKHLKVLEKVNGEVISKKRKSDDKCLLQQDSSEQSEAVIKGDKSTPSQNKEAPKKNVNGKHAKIKRKGSQKTLSSLFR